MSEKPVMNRWLVVVGALMIQLALGAIYAWSVFTPVLKDAAGPYNFSASQTQIIFSAGLATFAVVMVLAGKWMAKVGPRTVALTGGIVLGTGYILAGFLGSSFATQFIFIGLVGGAGIGLAYVTPIAVSMRWFPDRKGMITGLAVAGFGFGATGWIKLAGAWGHLLDNFEIFGLPQLQSVFFLYGIIFLIMVVLGSFVMVYPPEGWVPAGWTPPAPAAGDTAASTEGLLPGQMLRTPQYYMLLTTFIFSAMAGLMTIGVIKLFGIDALSGSGMDKALASAKAGTAMAVFFSLANGIGRIAWGTISDTLGWKKSIVIMAAVQGVFMLSFFWMGQSEYMLYLWATVIGFNFGGNFALFPVATADNFGTKTVGQNYGWVFLAYGVGGIVGPIMAGMFKDAGADKGVEAWLPAFLISGVLCLVAAVVASQIKKPKAA
jgi:MFS transporter, OFA family, oxalate/formate antiporter